MIFSSWFANNYTMIIVALGAMLLGFASGLLGVFNILKKQALVGDALSHATLPGVVIAFLLTNTRNMVTLLIGASLSALVAMFLINIIKHYSKIKSDASLALILSSFFGFGQVLILLAQERGNAAAGLKSFIFGQAATMLKQDVLMIAYLTIFILLITLLFWKEFKLYIFNDEFFQSLGFSKKITNAMLTFLTILIVVIGIRTVGVILMSALLIIPGVAARQWSNKLSINGIIAGFVGMISGLLGAVISSQKTNLPTGPVIVIVLSILVIVSLLFAPKRGIISKSIKQHKHQKDINKYQELISVFYNPSKDIQLSNDNFLLMENYLIIDGRKNIHITEKGKNKLHQILGGEH
ncbi:MAG: iron chelate uptake ABC transporter family permease subunit [Acholeplasma sp.]|nr:iron chelate uptake ABC transporter family permease subunit [Acholeplasma sp.]